MDCTSNREEKIIVLADDTQVPYDDLVIGLGCEDKYHGVPGADEPVLLKQVLTTVMEVTDVPLCIDTADPEALEAALKTYGAKALVN